MIQTARLGIRAPMAGDFETFWRMNNDPEVKRYTGGVTALSREAALAQHEESCRTFDGLNPAECIFSVEERSAGRCIGCCGLAPVMTINDDVYGKVTPDEVEGILAKYRD